MLYPKFSAGVQAKADMFKGDGGYRQLCCVTPFVLGIAMVGRIQRHYKHSYWFNIGDLGKMLGEYGVVSSDE